MWIFPKFAQNTLMNQHHATGQEGEVIAINWLSRQGFFILHTNWRCYHYELDIVAEKGEILHFVEVKTRKSLQYGYPEEGVTRAKFRRMKAAGAAYLHRYKDNRIRVQYDILSILLQNDQEPQITLIEDIG